MSFLRALTGRLHVTVNEFFDNRNGPREIDLVCGAAASEAHLVARELNLSLMRRSNSWD